MIILLRRCYSYKPFHLAEENRVVPAWTSYKYLENPATDHVIREYILQEQDQRTYLLCPKGFVIAQIGVALLVGQDQIERDEEIRRKTLVFTYRTGGGLPSDLGDRDHSHALQSGDRDNDPALQPEDLCGTLSKCLLYQACGNSEQRTGEVLSSWCELAFVQRQEENTMYVLCEVLISI